MKNTRKLFAGLTALCCMGTLLTAFPVSAESDFNPDDAGSFFIVNGTKGSATMLKWHYGEEYTYGDLVQTYPAETFSYGDVLVYDGEYTILETYPAQLGGNADNLRKVGTCEDFFQMKNLTITDAESLEGADVFIFKNFKLSDSDGTPYTYTQDYTNVDYEISLEQAEVGDVYTFACYRNSALLPVAKSETASVSQTAEDISQPFTAEITDETLGGCVMTLVKSDYLEESENWNAEYFNQEYGITNLKEVKSIFIDKFSDRRCVFFYPTDDTPETALEVAQKLYDTGLFYSVDLDAKTYLATEEEIITPDGDADGSGAIDILDVITVNRVILGKEDISADRIPHIDFNGNGIPDAEDSLVMMKMIVGVL